MGFNDKWNITAQNGKIRGTVELPISKSLTNRVQIIHYIGGFEPVVPKSDYPDDVNDLARVLKALKSGKSEINAGNGGTTYRFATTAAALLNTPVTLLAESQMEKRPIAELITPLRELGAEIDYLKTDGFPPVTIKRAVHGGSAAVNAVNSSQYAGALALAAPGFGEKTQLQLSADITSRPYWDMTLSVMDSCGARFKFENNVLTVEPQVYNRPGFGLIEKDLSAASYFYETAALSEFAEITLSNAANSKLQGDKRAAELFEFFGVKTFESAGDLILVKQKSSTPRAENLELDLRDTPDLAQTIACTAAGTGVSCKLKGLHTLRIKETDRISALQRELTKLGCRVETGADTITVIPPEKLTSGVTIHSHEDHRMVMSFAPLVLKTNKMNIEHYGCISKSYPYFKMKFEQLISVLQ